MIRSNKRKPGTISVTPVWNRRRDNIHIENSQHLEFSEEPLQCIESTQILKMSNVLRNRDKEETNKKRQQIPYLQKLDMSQMGIMNLEEHLQRNINLQRIKVVKLSENSIESLPSAIFNKLSAMTELYLDRNCLQKISFPYFKNNKIKIMNISGNQLTSLNMEHLQNMQTLNCSQNNLTFLTLPKSLICLDASRNRLSNVYFMEQCHLLREVRMGGNLLYDLKFNFSSFTKSTESRQGQIRFKYLQYLDCSDNKIQYFQGMINIINIKVLLFYQNQLSLTRTMMNELFILQSLEELELSQNPLCDGGFSEEEVFSMLCSKISTLQRLNGESTEHLFEMESQRSCFSSSSKSQFSGITDEPYLLFMPSQSKERSEQKPIPKQMQWNFTLGDYENENPKEEPINDLSLIEELKTAEIHDQILIKDRQTIKITEEQCNVQLEPRIKEIVNTSEKELKFKVVRSNSALAAPHHIHYQPFLKALLPMSYVPARPLFHGTSKVSSRRLEEDDDDHLLISKMFSNRGGVVYIKKVVAWVIEQNQEEVYARHCLRSKQPYMGFLLNEVSQKEFRQLSKFNKLFPRKAKDIIGMQPNVFSCFHIIVRFNSYAEDDEYLCAYLIESAHL